MIARLQGIGYAQTANFVLILNHYNYIILEMCMGMGNEEFLSLPWDSHGNGNQIT